MVPNPSDELPPDNSDTSFIYRVMRWVVDVRPAEAGALGLAFVYGFMVLSSYYVIRPIRDDMGVAGGVENLPWMFTATMLTMLVTNALFAAIVARMPRRKFIPLAYRFLILNLAVFVLLLTFLPAQNIWVGRVFFVWTSVFNLFVQSVFWAFMADVFSPEQGKRLFGFISVGGSLGAIMGALITSSLVQRVGPIKLLVVSGVLLELGVQCVRRFPHPPADNRQATVDPDTVKVGGGFWNGALHNFKSPYLLGISAYMLLYAFTSTVIYFQQVSIAQAAFANRGARTAFFAQIDLIVNLGTVVVQVFITGRLLKWIGVGATLAILPLLSIIGFLALGRTPVLGLLVVFLTLRRVGNFSLARPAREVLFTVISREDKYKAKNFIDTFVYRAGDQIGAWSFAGLVKLGLSLGAISFVAAPLAAVWLAVSLWLGRRQTALARPSEPASDSTMPALQPAE